MSRSFFFTRTPQKRKSCVCFSFRGVRQGKNLSQQCKIFMDAPRFSAVFFFDILQKA